MLMSCILHIYIYIFLAAEGDGDKSTTPGESKSDVLYRKKTLSSIEKAKALNMCKGFKSKNPFFILVMQPSYVITGRLVSFLFET